MSSDTILARGGAGPRSPSPMPAAAAAAAAAATASPARRQRRAPPPTQLPSPSRGLPPHHAIPASATPPSWALLPSPAVLLNLAAAFAAGVFVGEWTRQSKVNQRRRRQDRLLCGASSLATPGRRVVVVTTAALPWRTGTAVNPALRAAHLAASGLRVTLLVPWLPPAEQPQVYPPGQVFETPESQADHLVADAQRRAGFLPGGADGRFRVAWYRARYFSALGSILPVGDVTEAVPEDDAAAGCAVVLEEPEHLTWFAHRTRWTSRFPHVVGVMHTNYLSYVAQGLNGGAGGAVAASALYRINKWTCRLHCHKVIKLSDAVQRLPRQVTCNVHGVASCFIEQGRRVAAAAAKEEEDEAGGGERGGGGGGESAAAAADAADASPRSPATFSKGAYFIGKAVWGKGWRELLELLDYAQQKREQEEEEEEAGGYGGGGGGNDSGGHDDGAGDDDGVVDLYGGGEDLGAIEREAAARELRVRFLGPADHSDPGLIGPYRVFLNPSTSDVVATTTAEALAMGKWAVVEDLPCNAFFKRFRNCLVYRTPGEFAAHLRRALREDPARMTEEQLRALSWEAATERFLRASEIGPLEWPSEAERRYGLLLWRMYRSVTGFRLLRQALGLAPEAVVEGDRPTDGDGGGGGAGGDGEEEEEGDSELERVAAIEEADLLFSKGPEWFRSRGSSGSGDGAEEDDQDCLGAGGGGRIPVGSPRAVLVAAR